ARSDSLKDQEKLGSGQVDERRQDVYTCVTIGGNRMVSRRAAGEIRDAIIGVLSLKPSGASVGEIAEGVQERIGVAPGSSVRSYLRLNTPTLFRRTSR